MKTIELHILQSFPVTCLNRDDIGSPKSALFGGAIRARVSSQSWKRAIRLLASELQPEFFAGRRTRYIVSEIEQALKTRGVDEEKAAGLAQALAESLNTLDKKRDNRAVKTLMFFSPGEISQMVAVLPDKIKDESPDGDELKKMCKAAHKALGKDKPARDMADIAIFGRMVSDDHSLMLEGAGMFSHALSTHRVDNEIDFFAAVDDELPEDEEGAGHIGTIEFNSACYYRYIALNLDLLRDPDHLQMLKTEEFVLVLNAFIRATLLAVPGARKNSMMGFSPPAFVLGTIREGQPVSLANAFEDPIHSTRGYIEESRKRLEKHYSDLKDTYNLKPEVEVRIPDLKLEEFLEELLKNA